MGTKQLCTLLTAGAMLIGLASSSVIAAEVVVKAKQVYEKTVDNFIVLYDSSSSMADQYAETNMTRIEAERKVLVEANNTLPNLDWNAGIFLFTPGKEIKKGTFRTVLPVAPYPKVTFAKAVESLPVTPAGPTFLQSGLAEVDKIIDKLKGKTAVFYLHRRHLYA